MTTPRQEGVQAARAGKPYDENPYPETSEEAWQWLGGWIAYKEAVGFIL